MVGTQRKRINENAVVRTMQKVRQGHETASRAASKLGVIRVLYLLV